MAQLVKNPPAMQETWVQSRVRKIPWRRERLSILVFWPREFHGLYSPWGCKESNMTEWLSHEGGNGNPLHHSCLKNPMGRGWTWVWVNSRSWWWTGRPGMLQFMGLQRVGHNWATELNWTESVKILSHCAINLKLVYSCKSILQLKN